MRACRSAESSNPPKDPTHSKSCLHRLQSMITPAHYHLMLETFRPFNGNTLNSPHGGISIEDAVVHGIPGDIELKEGQIVGIDCGAEVNGYYGDHAKTFSVGKISSEKKKLMEITEESLYKGIEKAVPGNFVGDIGHAVQTHAESNGFSVVRELVGHGIGENLHEEPQVPNYGTPSQGYKLHAGMCIAIEPMINLGGREIYTAKDGWTILTADGKASAHFEHTIAILDDGPKILSKVSYNG